MPLALYTFSRRTNYTPTYFNCRRAYLVVYIEVCVLRFAVIQVYIVYVNVIGISLYTQSHDITLLLLQQKYPKEQVLVILVAYDPQWEQVPF